MAASAKLPMQVVCGKVRSYAPMKEVPLEFSLTKRGVVILFASGSEEELISGPPTSNFLLILLPLSDCDVSCLWAQFGASRG